MAGIFTLYTLVESIWIILPAYAANGLVPLLKGTHRIDGGRRLWGRELFGKTKTWEGLLFGTFIGVLIAGVEMYNFPFLPWPSDVPLDIAPMTLLLGALLGFGALAGDLAGSFLKRRLGLPSGGPAPVLDQDDFVVGALAFAALLVPVKVEWVVLLVIITPVFHWIAAFSGYKLGIKKTPW